MKTADFAAHLTEFLSHYLPELKNISTNTISSYCDAFRLFLGYCQDVEGMRIEKLSIDDLTPELVDHFLQWLRIERNNGTATRSQRLAAIRSFVKYLQIKEPRLLLKAGVGDTISNYTALYDWQLGCDENNDRPNDFAYMLSETAFNSLLYSEEKSLTSIPGIKMLAQSLVLSGLSMQLAGNSRPCSGSEHLFSHAMDELFDHNIPHGILVGMGSVVSCKLQGRDHHVVLDFLKAYDISVNPKKLGITEDMFIKAWMFAREVRKERYTILNKINLTEELFRQLYVAMLDECE